MDSVTNKNQWFIIVGIIERFPWQGEYGKSSQNQQYITLGFQSFHFLGWTPPRLYVQIRIVGGIDRHIGVPAKNKLNLGK